MVTKPTATASTVYSKFKVIGLTQQENDETTIPASPVHKNSAMPKQHEKHHISNQIHIHDGHRMPKGIRLQCHK